jgi:hypothetical protein
MGKGRGSRSGGGKEGSEEVISGDGVALWMRHRKEGLCKVNNVGIGR